MKSAIKILLLFLAASTSFTCQAQKKRNWLPGFLITEKGDTLFGSVKIIERSYNFYAHYTDTITGKRKIYNVNEVKYFKSGEDHYRKVLLPKKDNNPDVYAFAQIIEEGAVKLYFMEIQSSYNLFMTRASQPGSLINNNISYYGVITQEGTHIRLLTPKIILNPLTRNGLTDIFREKQDLVDYINSEDYAYQDIPRYVREFNVWKRQK